MSDRSNRRWRRLAHTIRTRDRNNGRGCAICGQPINWDTRNPNADDAPSVDHVKPWAHNPELRYDPDNLQTVHQACNRTKGTRQAALPSIGNQSRDWGRQR
jgi:5-methylcytosine-specific restriction endonuclease McrA